MSYEEKAMLLMNELKEKDQKTREKYKKLVNSQLDGSKETTELEENKQWYLKEIKKLKTKYKK